MNLEESKLYCCKNPGRSEGPLFRSDPEIRTQLIEDFFRIFGGYILNEWYWKNLFQEHLPAELGPIAVDHSYRLRVPKSKVIEKKI